MTLVGIVSAAAFVWLSAIVVSAARTQSTDTSIDVVWPIRGVLKLSSISTDGSATTSRSKPRIVPRAAAETVTRPGDRAVADALADVAPAGSGALAATEKTEGALL